MSDGWLALLHSHVHLYFDPLDQWMVQVHLDHGPKDQLNRWVPLDQYDQFAFCHTN